MYQGGPVTPDILIVSLILLAAIILLVTERFTVDVTGIGIIVVLMLTGLLTPKEAMGGFSNPAPLAVAALFVVSYGLVRTGALNFVSRMVIRYANGSRLKLMLLTLLLVGTLSAFLNNTPVVVLFMSIVMTACVRFGFTPSKFLIPLSYISILAGTCTLIGTSTNILVSDVAAGLGAAPITMFELSILGVPIALVGGAFMLMFSDFLLPAHDSPDIDSPSSPELYLSELTIPADSSLIGEKPVKGRLESRPGIKIYEVYRGQRIFRLDVTRIMLREDDLILVRASADEITRLLDQRDVSLPSCSKPHCFKALHSGVSKLVKVLIPSGSKARGTRLRDLYLADFEDVSIVGLIRRHEHYSWRKGNSQRLKVGDVLLVQVNEASLATIREEDDFIILDDDVVKDIVNWKRAPIAMVIFIAMIIATASGFTDILTASFAAGFAMILTNCLNISDAYRAVDVKVIMLIIGTIALGSAMQKTGADAYYAHAFLGMFQDAGPHVILTAFILLTSLLSHFLSNNSTAVLLVPIAIATAQTLNVDPRPFIIGVAFGASACYATPIGYQTNLIVYGPAGYRFADYLRLGLPMVAIVCGGAALFIPKFWPF
tara:strand:- start:4204 stop:6006 length:1803 start_codon:yes stop_codon:yes gene_type:complete